MNADVVYDCDAGPQGFNLFVYCGNNPINRIDISGADSEGIADGEDMLDELLIKEGATTGGGRSASGGSTGGSSNGYYSSNGNAGGNYSSNGQSRPTSPVRVKPNVLKDVDVHSFKQGFVGNHGSMWDIFKDTSGNSMLWLGNKSQTSWIYTGYVLTELINLFHKGWK